MKISSASRVTTVVISHNRRDELLRSLAHHAPPTVLVDNGSTDGTVDAVRRAYPQVRVVPLDGNRGASARNLGVVLAETPYVAFADDDSWWAAGALRTAAEILDRHPRVGLLAARILVGADHRQDPICTEMATSPLPPRPGLPGHPVLGFLSCGAVARRTAFLAAGGYDPVVFFMGEETRLALDLAAAGWELCYTPELVAHHHPSPRRNGRARHAVQTRNAVLTAVMRRPWSVVLAGAWRGVRSGKGGARGVLATLPRLPAAVAARRRLPADLEFRMRLLETAGG